MLSWATRNAMRSADERGICVRALGSEEVFLLCVLKKDCGRRGVGCEFAGIQPGIPGLKGVELFGPH